MARKRSKANYFTKETEEYIVKFNTSTDQDYRSKIFTDHIYFPFYKLAENIINAEQRQHYLKEVAKSWSNTDLSQARFAIESTETLTEQQKINLLAELENEQ